MQLEQQKIPMKKSSTLLKRKQIKIMQVEQTGHKMAQFLKELDQ